MILSGQAAAGVFTTKKADGSLLAATGNPLGTLYVNGVANGAGVTITGANPYKWAVTLPALSVGDTVQMYVTATVDAVATAEYVWADNVGIMPAVAGDQMDLVNAPNALAVTAIQAGLAVPGDAMDLVNDALDAASLAATAVQEITDSVLDEMSAAHVLPGSIGEAIAAASTCCSGPGAVEFIYTMTDSVTLLPIAGVDVWVTTDVAGANIIARQFTDAFGQITVWLDPGTYYFWRQRSGYTFTNPDSETVV